MNRLCWIGVLLGCIIVVTASAPAQTTLSTDEQTLKSNNLPTDGKGLLNFFQQRSLKEGDAKHLEALVKKLGSDVYSVREPARKELVTRGPVALPFLRGALANAPLEAKRRAELCIKDIEATMQSEPIAAAARVLAASKEPKAAEALFNFLPSISTDAFLEEEVLACVGRLTITPDKVDTMLLDALKDELPFRRHVAAYLVGRRGGAEHRDQLRKMLADKDPRVPENVATGLFGKRPPQVLQEALVADEKLLKDTKIELTEAALVKYLHDKTPSAEDQKRLRGLVRNLGNSTYVVRKKANEQLLKEGVRALGFLKEAVVDGNLEIESKRRAQELLREIRSTSNTAIPIAVAHLLARPPQKKDASPAEAIRALLDYVPFADDETVEEEVLTCLTLLSLREPEIEPALVKALADINPTKRSAAAYVLGHVGTKDNVDKVQPLLDDLHPIVRLRAAQGMLAARNKVAVPSFVKLLENLPATYLPRVEEVLFRLAEQQGPSDIIVSASDSPQKAAKEWTKWLEAHGAKIDLTNLSDRESYLGLITVCEYDNQIGNIQGRVWESTRGAAAGAKPRFAISNNIQGAMDAHTLPNGRVLVAENNLNRVTERDSKGDIKWEYKMNTNPICCQRLPNGNTFIASYNQVMEVTPGKVEVYRHTPGPQFYIFSAHKARNGNIIAITAQGQIMELDSKTGQTKNTVQTNTQGNWCSVELMPNGNYLVAALSTSTVKEIDRKGTEVWSKPFNGAFRATRLPNGNVLVASMNTREVVEMDRAGTIRWRTQTQGRPWSVHYR